MFRWIRNPVAWLAITSLALAVGTGAYSIYLLRELSAQLNDLSAQITKLKPIQNTAPQKKNKP